MSRTLYTTGEAAAAVGITRATVQAWIGAKKIRPPKATVLGNVTVRMWSEADVKMLREAKVRLYRKGRGRKPTKIAKQRA
jgi:excisionase family DNA binding protein